jgi:hypothetical protein
MARKLRSTLWTDADAKFTGSGNKWEGQELDDTIDDIIDSTAFEDVKYTMSSNTYDCSNGNLQERTLSSNGTLAITNAEAGRYYTLIKKGAFTLALPASEFTSAASTVPVGTAVITFLYDGTDYYFNYALYTGT